ncbi:MAG: hypothetical protein VX541_05460 [Candidatus Poribacteria bacterium]|nr:hypothetical protein [Candidatus Poribacteria bacterium]
MDPSNGSKRRHSDQTGPPIKTRVLRRFARVTNPTLLTPDVQAYSADPTTSSDTVMSSGIDDSGNSLPANSSTAVDNQGNCMLQLCRKLGNYVPSELSF